MSGARDNTQRTSLDGRTRVASEGPTRAEGRAVLQQRQDGQGALREAEPPRTNPWHRANESTSPGSDRTRTVPDSTEWPKLGEESPPREESQPASPKPRSPEKEDQEPSSNSQRSEEAAPAVEEAQSDDPEEASSPEISHERRLEMERQAYAYGSRIYRLLTLRGKNLG